MSSSTSSVHITSPFLQKEEPDVYGQRHPIETPLLIQTSLILLKEELTKLGEEEKQALTLAQEKNCFAKSDEHMLLFLRCEQFNVDLAAQRMCKYWSRRLHVFGLYYGLLPLTSKYFQDGTCYIGLASQQTKDKPDDVEVITEETSREEQNGINDLIKALSLGLLPSMSSHQESQQEMARSALTAESMIHAMTLGFMQILPGCDAQGRSIIWVEPRKLDSTYSRGGMLQAVWFIMHCALHIIEDDTMRHADDAITEGMGVSPQQKGVVFIVYLRDADPFRHFDISLIQACAESIRGTLPVRVSAIHFVDPPLLFDALYEVVQLVLGDLLKKRIQVHSFRWGCKYDVDIWQRVGINLASLPVQIGGEVTLDPEKWIKDRSIDSPDSCGK